MTHHHQGPDDHRQPGLLKQHIAANSSLSRPVPSPQQQTPPLPAILSSMDSDEEITSPPRLHLSLQPGTQPVSAPGQAFSSLDWLAYQPQCSLAISCWRLLGLVCIPATAFSCWPLLGLVCIAATAFSCCPLFLHSLALLPLSQLSQLSADLPPPSSRHLEPSCRLHRMSSRRTTWPTTMHWKSWAMATRATQSLRRMQKILNR